MYDIISLEALNHHDDIIYLLYGKVTLCALMHECAIYMAGCERHKEEVLVVSRRETHVFLYVVVSVIHFPLLHPAILAFDCSRKLILWLQLTLFVWLPV